MHFVFGVFSVNWRQFRTHIWYEIQAKTFSHTAMMLDFKFELIVKSIGQENVMFAKMKVAEKFENLIQYNDDW